MTIYGYLMTIYGYLMAIYGYLVTIYGYLMTIYGYLVTIYGCGYVGNNMWTVVRFIFADQIIVSYFSTDEFFAWKFFRIVSAGGHLFMKTKSYK